jgi:hypothetical protein
MLQAKRSNDLGQSKLDLINMGLTVDPIAAGNNKYPSFCSSLGDTAAAQTIPSGSADYVGPCCVHYELSNSGGFKKDSHIAVSRNKLSKKTTYEVAISLKDLIGVSMIESRKKDWTEGLVFGFSMLVNDGDDKAAQQGWGGYYPHSIVMGWNGGQKQPAKLGTVKLAGAVAPSTPPSAPGSNSDGGPGLFFGGFFLAVGLGVALGVAHHGYTQGWFQRYGIGKRVVTMPSGMGASLASSDHCQSVGPLSVPQA